MNKPNDLFKYIKSAEFPNVLSEWIGEVFYDILPEHDYEIRDEQIFTAYKIADAISKKNIHLAEAGPGTGKTFAYLLPAIAYAKYTRKPVIIACATAALQEQLGGPEGDIAEIAGILGIEVDARMAKDPRQFICDERVEEAKEAFLESTDEMVIETLEWLNQTKQGVRSEIPHIPDRIWKQISWHEDMACESCTHRGFCKLVKAREHYRGAGDLILADHGVFFDDLWTRDERILDGKLPILPSYSAVILDEGHKVILPAVMKAGHAVVQEDVEEILHTLGQVQGARKSLVTIVLNLQQASRMFFDKLECQVKEDAYSERLPLDVDEELLVKADAFRQALDYLLIELEIEQELYLESLPTALLQTYEAQIERATTALSRLYNQTKDVITWVNKGDRSFWVVPRNIQELLQKYLFKKGIPVVFTSATLSNEGDFSYFAWTLGLKKPTQSSVDSPFEIEDRVTVLLSSYQDGTQKGEDYDQRINQLVALLRKNHGRALVLTNSKEDVVRIRKSLKDHPLPFEVLWEDQGERGFLVRIFREDISSVLVGSGFWEGIDVPGESLSLVVIWQLPFPTSDPLIEERRKEAKLEGLDPQETVDYPEMGLRLKQGCGRLIRTEQDQGAIVILDPVLGTPWEHVVKGAIPPEAKVLKNEGFI